MIRRVVIADAGPLTALARIEALDLLRQLFGRVCITNTVRDEILPAQAAFADAEILARTLAEGWTDVLEVPPTDYRPLNPGVDQGEASSIPLADHWRKAGDAALLVMDDRTGRLEARLDAMNRQKSPSGPAAGGTGIGKTGLLMQWGSGLGLVFGGLSLPQKTVSRPDGYLVRRYRYSSVRRWIPGLAGDDRPRIIPSENSPMGGFNWNLTPIK